MSDVNYRWTLQLHVHLSASHLALLLIASSCSAAPIVSTAGISTTKVTVPKSAIIMETKTMMVYMMSAMVASIMMSMVVVMPPVIVPYTSFNPGCACICFQIYPLPLSVVSIVVWIAVTALVA